MKVNTHSLNGLFYPAIGAEIPLTGSKKQLPSIILETKHYHSDSSSYRQDAKKHLSQHFEMTAESKQLAVIFRATVLFL